jgi:hypothetical protein
MNDAHTGYSKAGMIAAVIMTVLSSIVVIKMAVTEHRFDWAITLGYVGGAGALFWRSYRPPLGFGQGLLTWVGGMIAGVGAGSAVFFVFQATRPGLGERCLMAVAILAALLAAGWGLLKLASRPPKSVAPIPDPHPPAS